MTRLNTKTFHWTVSTAVTGFAILGWSLLAIALITFFMSALVPPLQWWWQRVLGV